MTIFLRHSLRAALLLSVAMSAPALADNGFAISIGGETVAGDAGLAALVPPRAPAISSNAEVFVTVDGLGVRPRLDLEVISAGANRARLTSVLNYSDHVTRGEVRLVDLEATGGPTTLEVLTLAPGGSIEVALPEAGSLAAIHRVYDAAGRYDETHPIGLGADHAASEEQGTSGLTRRGIPVRGGAVTVSGRDLAPGAVMQAFGERFEPDAAGRIVVQRILPVGERTLPVRVTGGGENITLEPVVSIPRSEWFGTGRVEATLGLSLTGGATEVWHRGQAAFYTNGFTATGWEITASADTGEGPLDEIIQDFDHKSPLGVLARLNPELAYPTYGDDSEIVNDAPTDGKLYVRVERDGSYAMWGNARAPLQGTEYLRNERTLYGFSGVYQSQSHTARGEPRVAVQAYAAQPDRLPARDIFRGTGGSIFFLQRQDIALGSETITVELRDPDTGRVLGREILEAGRDYEVNYFQGTVTLARPFSATASGGVVQAPAGEAPVRTLVVQYEYTPTATDIDGFSYGGRAEAWVNDDVRLGVTGMVEQTGTADQTAVGADVLWRIGEASHLEAEIARSSGPGFATVYSADGGVIFGSGSTSAGTGMAARLDGHFAFSDIGIGDEGEIDVWAEWREAGFSTLDYAITDTERFAGFDVAAQPSEDFGWRIRAERYESDSGKSFTEGLVETSFAAGMRTQVEVGLAFDDRIDPTDPTKTGLRTDIAGRVTHEYSEALDLYVFGQYTALRTGGRARNDRYGAGLVYEFSDDWSIEAELSHGTAGLGGRGLLSYESGPNSAYVGYERDPGREIGSVSLLGRDNGRLTAGGRYRFSDAFSVFSENSYDLFGEHKAFSASYGAEYTFDTGVTLTGAYEIGRVVHPSGDFDRDAFSLGVSYSNETGLEVAGRVEYRRDRGTISGGPADTYTIAAILNGRYTFSEAARLTFGLDLAMTETTSGTLPEGEYARATIGYAFRPTEDDRLNLLARYAFLHDMYGQEVDGTDTTGPVQQSHVFSLDATYEINERWELGAKVGARLGESAPDASSPLVRNNAYLAVLNARYHFMNEWDALGEVRYLHAPQAGFSKVGALATISRQINENMSLGIGYNFGSFSDDLFDLTTDDHGVFLNLVTHF